MSDETIGVRLAAIEAANMITLIDEFVLLISESPASDPAVARLAPDAYPDDREASAEFRQATADTIRDRRRTDALTVRHTLEPAAADADAGHALAQHRILLSEAQADCWMRTLAAMRLVLASMLGIATADDHRPGDPRFDVYDWLGYRLELIVNAADARDE